MGLIHTAKAALVLVLTAALAGCGVGDGSPSEADMRQALENKFGAINSELENLAGRCVRREFNDNPLIAMQCLSICVSAGNESCNVSFKLTEFRKIGCKEVVEQPGYVCDFVAGFSSTSPYVQSTLSALLGGGGSHGQGRFVNEQGGWTFISMNQ
jgi:hypothetical protein